MGYRASQELAVTCPDLSLAGQCLTAAAEAAGNDLAIDGISLEISDSVPLRVLARERAFADAKSRATQYAALAGRNLGSLDSLQEGRTVTAVPTAYDLSEARAAVDIKRGEMAVSVTVTARWSFAD